LALLVDKKLLPCQLCGDRFSVADVDSAAYFADTNVCAACYQRMKEQAVSVSCFGKLYQASDPRCAMLCPDASVCKNF
jgi:hypothetical protein